MKRKFLIITLCFTIVFSSLNIKRSHANPLIVGKVAEVSIIYAIGRLAFDTIGLVGTIADVIDLGGSIYSKMSDKEKEDYKNSIKFEDDKFTYSEESYNYISSYVPDHKGYHLMFNIERTHIPNIFYDNNYNKNNIKDIFESKKETITIQGFTFDVLLHKADENQTSDRYLLCYKPSNDSLDSLVIVNGTYPKTNNTYFKLFMAKNSYNNGDLTLDWYRDKYIYMRKVIKNNIPNKCDNCPHDISLKDTYEYPTQDELDYIEKYYPEYENDIVIPGGSNGGGSNGGGSNGGGSNGDINNSPIISNPPSFPNLEEFDFSGLQLEPLTNLFSNFKNKFPFSLPFDLANLLNGLVQDPIPPIFESELFGETITLDLTRFTELANILKMFTILGYLVSLILITKKFGG